MARWFNNGTKMADGTLISFAAHTELEVQECLKKGWTEVGSDNVEAYTEENLTKTPAGEVSGITKSGNQRRKPGPKKKVAIKEQASTETNPQKEESTPSA